MARAALLKRVAPYTLMLCFILPLSQCDAPRATAGMPQEPDSITYG